MATEVGITELANDTELEVVEITTGLALVPGPKGDKGDTGPAGPVGPQGEQGPIGPAGPQGEVGPQGADGPRGAQGLTGPIGATGATGPKGDAGAAGPKGDTGSQGPAGATGATGPKGDTGATGASGAKGDKGDTGSQGPAGSAGMPGEPGLNGESVANAYIEADGTLVIEMTNGATFEAGNLASDILAILPAGGTAGQILAKIDDEDYHSEWIDAPEGTGTNAVQGFVLSCSGKPAANEIVVIAEAPYAFTASETNCSAKAVTAATASAVFTIRKGAVEVGTFTFAVGSATATVSITSGAIAKGDLVTITAPATADATLSDISFTVRA